jgi:GNAT superfamily N-acetyltransferase
MQQLRPHLVDVDAFVQQVERQCAQGYQMVCCRDEEGVWAVMGFRFLEFLAWGKVLYIDDLITDAEKRKNGYAGKLLQWAIDLAEKEDCDQVHLDSGSHRHDAHRLYLKSGFKIIGYHFELDL